MPPIFAPFIFGIGLLREIKLLFDDRRYRALVFWMVILIIGGTFFYNRIEGWGFIDSFYFTIVTLATVGYGDFAPTTPVSKLFTSVYIVLGIGFFLSFVNLLAQERNKLYEERENRNDDGAVILPPGSTED